MLRGILRTACQYFDDEDWHYQVLEQTDTLLLGYEGEHGVWPCVALAREGAEQFIFYSVLEPRVPPERRMAMAEFITRVNYDMVIGNFELDFSDGEVRYKTSIDVEGDRLTPQLVHMLVGLNVETMDRYLPGLMRVIREGGSPEQILTEIDDDG